jgi:small lipoprotein (TIGR04452 family)
MKIFNSTKASILLVAVIVLTTTQCYMSPITAPGQIKGSEAKKKLISAAQEADILYLSWLTANWCGIAGSASCNSLRASLAYDLAVNTIVIPAIAGINPDVTYKNSTVDECADTIRTLGYLIGSWASTATCNVEQTQTIQLGPIGIL